MLRASAVGQSVGPWKGRLDARWLMAYAAAVGQFDAVYLDTTRTDGVAVHPVFPIAPEWALLTNPDTALDLGLEPNETRRGVHVRHAVMLHCPLRQDIDVVLRAQVAGVETTRAGARLTIRFDAEDTSDRPLWTTWMQSIYLGVGIDGDPIVPEDAPPRPTIAATGGGTAPIERRLELDAGAAHVYSECARIWNPIHTDRAVAQRAGLPDVVLHGSATLARGVSVAVEALGIAPTEVASFGGSFRVPVRLPSTITVVVNVSDGAGHRTAGFEVRTDNGDLAITAGYVTSAD